MIQALPAADAMTTRNIILVDAADSRAMPYANEQMQSPALNGACTHCWSVGCMVQPGNTFYVNALARITDKHERGHIVKEALASFKHAPTDLKELLFAKIGPAEKEHSEILGVGKAAERDPHGVSYKNHKRKDGYIRRDAFATHYPGEWDSARQFMTCTSHQIGNTGAGLFGLVMNRGDGAFDVKRRRLEADLGRIEYLAPGVREAIEQARALAAIKKKGKAASKNKASSKGFISFSIILSLLNLLSPRN